MRTSSGIFSYTPEPHIAFCPIFVHPLFPCLNPIFKNGSFLSVVALVSVTLLDSNPRPSTEKRSILAPTPSSSLARTTTIELPECQERRGVKTTKSVFLGPGTPSQEHGLCPPLGFQPAFLLKVQRWGFRVFRVFRVF